MSIRTERVAGEVQKALSVPLARIASEISAGIISVTEVRMSPDLQTARVYLSVFGGSKSPTEVLTYIEAEEAGRIRHYLGRNVKLRYVPQLHFYIDDSLEHAMRINAILDSVRPDPAKEDGDVDA